MDIFAITDQSVPWECWRGPDHYVYFRHSKCASSTYVDFFKKLGWQKTDSQQINWTTDKVFGHIRDPLTKHRKGLVEYFFYNKQYTDLVPAILNTKLIEVISDIIYLDHHSMSLYDQLGDNAKFVTWIPIDTALDHKQVTLDFVGLARDDFLNSSRINESTAQELDFFKQITAVPVSAHVLRYIDFDDILYQHAVAKFRTI